MTFDLQSVLPQLLPGAIAWAEQQSQKAAQEGTGLNESEQAMARGVGVAHPEQISTITVNQLPLPDDPLLKQAALQTGLLGPGMVGLTLGHSIFIVRGFLNLRLLSHECRHVHQYESYGSIAAFLPIYLQQIATVGYDEAPLERDARAHELNG
jgi:hypothetical protein